jgi:uncharacterized phiE125 gp8 family phage protein
VLLLGRAFAISRKEILMSWTTLISPPATEPITLADAKAWLRIATSSEDALIASLIAAARNAFETETGIALVTRRLRRHWQQWPKALVQGRLVLSPGPAAALIDVTIRNDDGDPVSDITDQFALQGGALDRFASLLMPHIPDGGALTVTFDAGFGAAADVPDRFKQALREIIRDAYARGSDGTNPGAIAASYRAVQL